jgi:hypothetical protein
METAAGVNRRRVASAGFGDARLWVGIGLVVASVVVGVGVMSADRDTVTVLRATRDLSVGATPTNLDRVAVSRAAVGDAYLTGEPAGDAVLRWPVRAGELVPRGALAEPPTQQHRQVTVAVDPLHAPVDLQEGDHVDVWASSASPSRAQEPPKRVVADARVASVSGEAVGIGGELAVVLDLAPDDVLSVVEAVRTGVVDLVAVPVDSQPAGGLSS